MLSDRKFPLVSVIISVYKAERYLEECIASVLGQDYQNIEVIFVDDGSPDLCPAICDDYSGKYENIRVIHQENQGAGAARNRGMEIACGEYLMFVDSDDCLDGKCAVRKLVEKAEEEQADIVTGNFRRFNVSGFSKIHRHHLKGGKYARTVDFRFKGFLTENHLISDWGKLYRASFLRTNHLKHMEYRVMEDKLYNMPNNLSGGQQQRAAIARALVTKPAIVLADEPTGNLDSHTSADVLGLLKRTGSEFNQTIVMITHNQEIAQLADRIVRIEDGKIKA